MRRWRLWFLALSNAPPRFPPPTKLENETHLEERLAEVTSDEFTVHALLYDGVAAFQERDSQFHHFPENGGRIDRLHDQFDDEV